MDLDSYLGVKDRVIGLARAANADCSVPSCPDWTVRDVLAHLAGLCEDWVAQNLDGYGSGEWTEAQIRRFAGDAPVEIIRRWEAAVEDFSALPDDPVMGPPSRWAFGDGVIHEADLRGALDRGRVPHDAMALSLKGSISRWRQVLAGAGTPSLLLHMRDLRDWRLGSPDDPGAVSVEAPAYEVFRALAGRRSRAQVGSWDWQGDSSGFLDAGLPYPFTWATADLED